MKTIVTKVAAAGCTALALGLFSPAPAAAEGGVKGGLLQCDTAGSRNFIITSTTDLACTYSPVAGETTLYRGEIRTFGVDLEFNKSGVLFWKVLAPSTNVDPGALEGGYAGAKGSISAGVGVGANVLIGGSDRAVTLQPVSVEGIEGISLAAGVAFLDLTAVR